MAVKKTTSAAKTAAKAVKAEPAKTETKAAKAETAKETVKAVKAEPAKEAAKAIETKKDTTKKLETKAGVLVDTPAEKTEEKKTTAAKKTAAKKTTARKTTAAKTTAAKKTASKTTVKKTAEKKAEIKTEMYLQFAGKEYSQDEIIQKVKDIWTYDLHLDADDIKDVKLYLKPEESAAYYVVNGVESGKVIL